MSVARREARGVRATILHGLTCLERTLPPGERYPGDGGVYGDPLAAARAWIAHAEPPGMVSGVQVMLNSAGVTNDDIRTEKFAGY